MKWKIIENLDKTYYCRKKKFCRNRSKFFNISNAIFLNHNKKVGRISLHKYVCARAYVCATNDNIEFTGLWIYFWILLLEIIFSLKKVRNQIIYKLSKYFYFVFFLCKNWKNYFYFSKLSFSPNFFFILIILFFIFLRLINLIISFLFLFLFLFLLFFCLIYSSFLLICVCV